MIAISCAWLVAVIAQQPQSRPTVDPVDFPKASANWSIRGKVVCAAGYLEPTKRPIKTSLDLKKHFPDGTYVRERDEMQKGGLLPHVFVSVSRVDGKPVADVWRFETPEKTVKLAMHGYRYVPHVIGVMVGQKLQVVSEDSNQHNVHWLGKRNRFAMNNFVLMPRGSASDKFRRPEHTRFIDDVYGWMSCEVHIVSHPLFTVTDANGRFSLPKLPEGRYEITAMHERWGSKTAKVTLKREDGQTKLRKRLDFSLGPRPKTERKRP